MPGFDNPDSICCNHFVEMGKQIKGESTLHIDRPSLSSDNKSLTEKFTGMFKREDPDHDELERILHMTAQERDKMCFKEHCNKMKNKKFQVQECCPQEPSMTQKVKETVSGGFNQMKNVFSSNNQQNKQQVKQEPSLTDKIMDKFNNVFGSSEDQSQSKQQDQPGLIDMISDKLSSVAQMFTPSQDQLNNPNPGTDQLKNFDKKMMSSNPQREGGLMNEANLNRPQECKECVPKDTVEMLKDQGQFDQQCQQCVTNPIQDNEDQTQPLLDK